MRKVALIDADSIIYILANGQKVEEKIYKNLGMTEEEKDDDRARQYAAMDKAAMLQHLDSFITSILTTTKATHYLGFLGGRGGSDTFRHRLAKTKPYKGNRGPSESWIKFWKPIMVEHLVSKWGFVELFDIEADDACTIFQSAFGDESVICSSDKDLKQCKGFNYNYKTFEEVYIDEFTANYNLYYQLLVGDSTDNIAGCKGVGKNLRAKVGPDGKNLKVRVGKDLRNVYYVPVDANGVPTAGAPKVLYGLGTAEEMSTAVMAMYAKKGHSIEYMKEQMALIFMLRTHTKETENLVPVKYSGASINFMQEEKASDIVFAQ